MKEHIKKLFATFKGRKDSPSQELGEKVERGTQKAIKEYGYVFKKLAEFDRT